MNSLKSASSRSIHSSRVSSCVSGKPDERRLHLRAALVGRIAGDVRPRPAVARPVVERVEELRRDVHALEQRVERRRLERPDHGDLRAAVGGRADRHRVADPDVVVVGEVAADDRVRRPERREDRVIAVAPVEDVCLSDRVRLDAADLGAVAVHQTRVGANARDHLGRGRRREGVPGGGDERRVAVERGHDVVGDDLLLDRFAVRRLHPVRERRDEGDERDPDHQRRGRRGRSSGVANRVSARQATRDAAGASSRQPDDPRDRPHEPRREHRDAEEQQEHATRDREQPITRVELVREHRAREREQRDDDEDPGDPRREAVKAPLRERRTLTHRGDRRHARRPDRGEEPGEERDAHPDDERHHHGPGREDAICRREVGTQALEQRLDPFGEEHAEREPDERREQPDDERLEDHRPEYLPPGRADRPQRRELTRPLSDGDREGVEDDERAHEERDAGEREQEVAEELRELAHVVRLLLRLRRRAHDLGVLRKDRLDRRDEIVLGDTLVCSHGDRVVLALATQELLRGGDREHAEAEAAEALKIAVLRDADQRERALRLQRGDLHGVADGPALVVHGSGIEDHLVGGPRPVPLVEGERVEPGVRRSGVDAEAERRPALVPDRLAVRVEDRRASPRPRRFRSRARLRRRRARRRAATRRSADPVASRRRSRCRDRGR